MNTSLVARRLIVGARQPGAQVAIGPLWLGFGRELVAAPLSAILALIAEMSKLVFSVGPNAIP
jgi:hypothetical protein